MLKLYFPLHLRSCGMRGSHNMSCSQLKIRKHSALGQTVAGRKKDVCRAEECSLFLSLYLLPSTVFLPQPRQYSSGLMSCPCNLHFPFTFLLQPGKCLYGLCSKLEHLWRAILKIAFSCLHAGVEPNGPAEIF